MSTSYNLLVESVVMAVKETIKEQNNSAGEILDENESLKHCIAVCLKVLMSYLDNESITNLLSISPLKNINYTESDVFDARYLFKRITKEYDKNYQKLKKQYIKYINWSNSMMLEDTEDTPIWIPMIQVFDIRKVVSRSLLNKYNHNTILFHLCVREKLMFDLLHKYTGFVGEDHSTDKYAMNAIISKPINRKNLRNMSRSFNLDKVNHFRSHYVKVGSWLDVLMKKTKSFDNIFDLNNGPFGSIKSSHVMIRSLKKLLLMPLIDPLVKDWLVIDGKAYDYSFSLIFGYISPKYVIAIGGVFHGTMAFF